MYARMLDKQVRLSKEYQLEIKIQEKDSTDKPIYHKKLSYFSFIDKFPIFCDHKNEWAYFQELDGILAFIKAVEGTTYTLSVQFHSPDNATPFECEEMGESEILGEEIQSKIKSLLNAWKLYVSVEFEK